MFSIVPYYCFNQLSRLAQFLPGNYPRTSCSRGEICGMRARDSQQPAGAHRSLCHCSSSDNSRVNLGGYDELHDREPNLQGTLQFYYSSKHQMGRSMKSIKRGLKVSSQYAAEELHGWALARPLCAFQHTAGVQAPNRAAHLSMPCPSHQFAYEDK